jgi:hypothetical protein
VTSGRSIAKMAATIAALTEDAYSFHRYASWKACAAALLRRGYNEEQTEEILRSKITRWAADMARGNRATANDLVRFMDNHPNDVRAVVAIDPVTKSAKTKSTARMRHPKIYVIMEEGLEFHALRFAAVEIDQAFVFAQALLPKADRYADHVVIYELDGATNTRRWIARCEASREQYGEWFQDVGVPEYQAYKHTQSSAKERLIEAAEIIMTMAVAGVTQ